jgi:hypothetical protein
MGRQQQWFGFAESFAFGQQFVGRIAVARRTRQFIAAIRFAYCWGSLCLSFHRSVSDLSSRALEDVVNLSDCCWSDTVCRLQRLN